METGELMSKIDLTGATALTIVGALDPEIKNRIFELVRFFDY